MNIYEKEGNIYAISTVLAMGGCLFAPLAFAVPTIMLAYGLIESMLNEEFYSNEIKKLSNETLQKENVKMKRKTPTHMGSIAYGH